MKRKELHSYEDMLVLLDLEKDRLCSFAALFCSAVVEGRQVYRVSFFWDTASRVHGVLLVGAVPPSRVDSLGEM